MVFRDGEVGREDGRRMMCELWMGMSESSFGGLLRSWRGGGRPSRRRELSIECVIVSTYSRTRHHNDRSAVVTEEVVVVGALRRIKPWPKSKLAMRYAAGTPLAGHLQGCLCLCHFSTPPRSVTRAPSSSVIRDGPLTLLLHTSNSKIATYFAAIPRLTRNANSI